MSILLDEKTRVVVLGITGSEGTFHAQKMIEYGTKVVAGMTPGKGGTTHLGVPVFNTVAEAAAAEGADAAAIFVPPFAAADAIMECADAGLGLVVCITEGHPDLRHAEGQDVPPRQAGRADRPEHAGHHLARARPRSGSCPGPSTKRARSASFPGPGP